MVVKIRLMLQSLMAQPVSGLSTAFGSLALTRRGVGANMIWVAPEQKLVAVVRWIDRDAFDGFTAEVMAALR